MKIISSQHNKDLSSNVCHKLNLSACDVETSEFPNGEYKIQIKENVENEECIIINSLSDPTHSNIIELLLLADALNHLSSKEITAIIPWLAYSPQDKIFRKGEPLSSKAMISILESSPINNFVLFDVHSPLVLRFFNRPYKELSAIPLFSDYIQSHFHVNAKDWTIVSLDAGSKQRSNKLAKLLGLDVYYFAKQRDRVNGETEYIQFPNGLQGKNILIVDDFISTGGSLVKAINFLKGKGVNSCYCFVTHCVTREGIEKVLDSDIDKLVLTNSIKYDGIDHNKLEILDLSPIIAEYLMHK